MLVTTVTLNPMLDKTVSIEKLERGAIHRASTMEMVAGGKGVNVSRQLKQLGVSTIASGFIGGWVGLIVAELIRAEGIEQEFIRTDVPTREGVTYREPNGIWTAVFEPPMRVSAEKVHELDAKLNELISKSAWLVCSGSSPGYEADDLYYEAILFAHKSGAMSVLDSYGEAFKLALKAAPSFVKINRTEFEQTFGGSLATEDDFVNGLTMMLSLGIQYCVITDGARPCYAAVQGHYWKVTPPPIQPINPTGSGDAMIAAILYGFSRGWKFQQCLSFGIAAGAANAQKWEVANSQLQEITSLEERVSIQRLR